MPLDNSLKNRQLVPKPAKLKRESVPSLRHTSTDGCTEPHM